MLFITLEPYRLYETKKLESPLILMILMRNIYLLHIINKMKKKIDIFIDLLYIYISREIIIPNKNNSCKHSKDKTNNSRKHSKYRTLWS